MFIGFYHVQRWGRIRYQYVLITLFSVTLISIYREPDNSKEYTLVTDGCKIPYVSNEEYELAQMNFDPDYAIKKCPPEFALLQNNDTHIWIDYMYIWESSNPSCCYQPFYRTNSVTIYSRQAGHRVDFGRCIPFKDYIEVKHEFVMINCRYSANWNSTIYLKKPFLFAIKKPLESAQKPPQDGPIGNVIRPTYNVIILGIDSMSRFNFYRSMPNTLDYLQSRDALELMGYNKVGHGLFESLMPLFIGQDASEMRKTCLPHSEAYLDNCPFLWHLFKKSGYYTAFAEECSNLFRGTSGFLLTPTDYYLETYFKVLQKWNRDMYSIRGDCEQCIGVRYSHIIFLEYVNKLLNTLSEDRLFGFFWLKSMSHEVHTLPEKMDSKIQELFEDLDRYLNNTILIVMGDRGISTGLLGKSKIGKFEERLPILLMLFPTTFGEYYPIAYENLKRNQQRLTTPFDMYETLSDLANVSLITNEGIQARTEKEYWRHRGISLFLPIPGSRTCESAGLSNIDCSCQRGESVNFTKSTHPVNAAASFTVDYINYLVQGYSFCIQFQLQTVLEATEFFVNGAKEYEIFFVVKPSETEYYARVRQIDDEGWLLVGKIERIGSKIGIQCRMKSAVDQYCFCDK